MHTLFESRLYVVLSVGLCPGVAAYVFEIRKILQSEIQLLLTEFADLLFIDAKEAPTKNKTKNCCAERTFQF